MEIQPRIKREQSEITKSKIFLAKSLATSGLRILITALRTSQQVI